MSTYMLLANVSAFEVGVNQLREHLFPLAFILVVLGIWESTWKGNNDPRSILGIVIKTTIIVVLLAGFPALMKHGKEAFDGLNFTLTTGLQNNFKELLDGELPTVEARFSDIGPYIASLAATTLQYLGSFGVNIVKFFQQYAIGCLTAVSPLMISLLAITYTQSIGIRFLMTSLCVIMWSLGFILVDLFLSYLGPVLLGGIMGGIGGAPIAAGRLLIISWPAAVGTMLVAALVPTFLYIATPMAISKLMAGANAGTAAAWGGLSNMSQGAQYASRGAQIASTLRTAATAKTGSTEGSIPRPSNPIV